MTGGTLWVSAVPGRPWAAHDQSNGAHTRLRTPNDTVRESHLRAKRRVQQLDKPLPKEPSRRSQLPLLDPSPREREGIERAARRAFEQTQLMLNDPTADAKQQHATMGPKQPTAPLTPRPRISTIGRKFTTRKPGAQPAWTWIPLPSYEARTPALAHHSLHVVGFGAARYIVAYGGRDAFGKHSATVHTLPLSSLASLSRGTRPLPMADVQEEASASAATSRPPVPAPTKSRRSHDEATPDSEDEDGGEKARMAAAAAAAAVQTTGLTWSEEKHLAAHTSGGGPQTPSVLGSIRSAPGASMGGSGPPAGRYAHASCTWGLHRILVHGGHGGQVGRHPRLLGDTAVLVCSRKSGNLEACEWSWASVDIVGQAPSPRRFHAMASVDVRMAFVYGGELNIVEKIDAQGPMAQTTPNHSPDQTPQSRSPSFTRDRSPSFSGGGLSPSSFSEGRRGSFSESRRGSFSGWLPGDEGGSFGRLQPPESAAAHPSEVQLSAQMFALVDIEAELEHGRAGTESSSTMHGAFDPDALDLGIADVPSARPRLAWGELTTSGSSPPALSRHALMPAGQLTIALVGGRGVERTSTAAYNVATYLFDVETFSWAVLKGVGVPEKPWLPKLARGVHANGAAGTGDSHLTFGVGALPREQAAVASLAVHSQASPCLLVLGGVAPIEGGGKRTLVTTVETYHANATRWLPSQVELIACPAQSLARRAHRCTPVSSCAAFVSGGVVPVTLSASSPAASGLATPRRTRAPVMSQGLVHTRSAYVASVSPRRLDVEGGDALNIYGEHFEQTGQIEVRFTALLPTDWELSAEARAVAEVKAGLKKAKEPPRKRDVYNEDEPVEITDGPVGRRSGSSRGPSSRASITLSAAHAGASPNLGHPDHLRIHGPAASHGDKRPSDGWAQLTRSRIVPAVYVDEHTLRVDTPNMQDIFVEGPATVEVSLHEPLPGKERVWTEDHVEVSLLASASSSHTQWYGSGLRGGLAGERCKLTAYTMDVHRRPKRLGGIPMALELVWLKPTEVEAAQSTQAEIDALTDTTDDATIVRLVQLRLSMREERQAAARAAARAVLGEGAFTSQKKATAAAKAEAEAEAAMLEHQRRMMDDPSDPFNVNLPSLTLAQQRSVFAAAGLATSTSGGSCWQRRGIERGDMAASAASAAPAAAISSLQSAGNTNVAADPDHLREAHDLRDGRYQLQYREIEAGYYRAIALSGGVAIHHFVILIEPGRLSPDKCFVGGTCLTANATGEHALHIELHDKYGNAAAWPESPGVLVNVCWEDPNPPEQSHAPVEAATKDKAELPAVQINGRGGQVRFSGEGIEAPVAGSASASAGKSKPRGPAATTPSSIYSLELTEAPVGGNVPLRFDRVGRYTISVTHMGKSLGKSSRETNVVIMTDSTSSAPQWQEQAADDKPQWPPPTVTIEGKEFAVGPFVAKGIWAHVFKGTGPAGEEVALKMLHGFKEQKEKNGDPKPFEKLMPPRNSAEQQAENAIECKIHKYMQSIADGADCAKVPMMLGSDATNAAIEFIEAMSLEAFLRESDRSKIDDADAAAAVALQVKKVLAVVIKKVFTLYGRAKEAQFSHRDLNDGNIMLRLNVNVEDVKCLDDVDVWLFDFGKSMARIDGSMVSGGMWNPIHMPKNDAPPFDPPGIPKHDDPSYDGCRISEYNETTDTVRLLTNITQSLIRSYEPLVDDKGKKVNKKSPTGATRIFLEKNMPFGSQMATWLAHTKQKLGAEEYDQLWDKSIAKSTRGSTTELSGKQDYLDFAAQPSLDILRKYYVFEEADWCECMLPAKLVEFCDGVLAA